MDDFSSLFSLNFHMNILEKTQHKAALAITGTWKGTNTDKLYEELGWESLHNRRIFRRLIMLYKIQHNLAPAYLKTPITNRIDPYLFRRNQNLHEIRCRQERFRNSFYPNTIKLWNRLDCSLKNAPSLSCFKTSFLKLIRPTKKDMYNIYDPLGRTWLFQLRVGLSPLKVHKKRHKFLDTNNDICDCLISAETTKHYLLECPLYIPARRSLTDLINPLLRRHRLDNIANENLTKILLYGHKLFNFLENQFILKSTIVFIKSTNRFST